MKHYIVYIPGLGDKYDGIRSFLLRSWRIFGVQTELVPMQWYDGKSFEEKYQRVVSAIERAQKQGYSVSIIGESAGGSMAINAFSMNTSIHRMISLCGVNTTRSPISSYIFKKGPAFGESVSKLDRSQTDATSERIRRVTSIVAFKDSVVPAHKNTIEGARQVIIPSIGHLTTILLCLSVYSFLVVREVKRPI
jgi:hypothetical protein